MINYAYQNLFSENSIGKQYSIQVYNGSTLETTITNEELYSEDIERHNPLCTEETVRYGACEASYVKFTVRSTVGTLKNRKLIISVTPDGGTALQLGEYYVDSDELSDDRQSRQIIAYDVLYKIINTDMLKWYGEVGLPMTMKDFRDAFFDYFDVEQIEVTLCNDAMPITETILADSLSGLEVLSAILAGNGVLGTITNEGKFRYVKLSEYDTKAYGTNYKQGTLVYEDYLVQPIATLKFYSNKCDIVVGADPTTSSNIYIMEDNFLFYDKIETDLTPYVQNIFDVIKLTPVFRPLKAETYGDPCVEVGDMITFTSPSGDTFTTFVLDKTEKGLQALSDNYDIMGTEFYVYDLNDSSSSIRRLWNNTLAAVSEARCYVYAQRNTGIFNLTSTEWKTIISIPIASVDDTIPVFLATIPLTMSLDGEVHFRYFLDGLEINVVDNDCIYLTKGEQFVTISTFFEMPGNTRKRFEVTAKTAYRQSVEREQTAKIISLKDWVDNQGISVQTSGGVTTASFTYTYVDTPIDTTPPGARIDAGRIRAMIFASGLASEQPWDGTITVVEDVTDITLEDISVANASDSVTVATQVPISPAGASDIAGIIILEDVIVPNVSDTVFVEKHTDSFPLITEDTEEQIITETDDYALWTEGD